LDSAHCVCKNPTKFLDFVLSYSDGAASRPPQPAEHVRRARSFRLPAGAVGCERHQAGVEGRRLPAAPAAQPVRGTVSAARDARQPEAVQPRGGAQPLQGAQLAGLGVPPGHPVRAHPLPVGLDGARAGRGQLHGVRQRGPLGHRLRLPLTADQGRWSFPRTLLLLVGGGGATC